MYQLSNKDLTVSILDPLADRARLGSRYCTGGYIWQVSDVKKGELISGPEYPKEPNTFDGQGMPDMFHRPLLPVGGVPVGGAVACIGVGLVRRSSPVEPFEVRHNPEVLEFVFWDVDTTSDIIAMRTAHNFHGWAYRLERTVSLRGRTVHSRTAIYSLGTDPLPVRWFAHPFFPLTEDNVLCQFSIPISMPENPGYFLNSDSFVTRKADHHWQRGWYQPLDYEKTAGGITVVEKHPKIGQVATQTNFCPTFLPIWGNHRTFSFEPYFERELVPGEGADWSIEYTFS
jgi:hypothetical protein